MNTALDPALFPKRASKVISNAALHDLVQDMAGAMAAQAKDIAEIKHMCTKILERLVVSNA